MRALALALLAILAGCDHGGRIQSISPPPGGHYRSPGGVEVYVPDADTASMAEILARVDGMPVDEYQGGAIPWSDSLRGLPLGWSWVLMGDGPFMYSGVNPPRLISGLCDYDSRTVYASTWLRYGQWFALYGLVPIPAGPHEAAHAWSQTSLGEAWR